MLGYGQYSRSLNGIKTLSATDIEGQIVTPQNNLQIGNSLTIDENLQVDNTSTLNQVFVDGIHLNAFMTAVDAYFNGGGLVTPVLGNIIYGGTVEYIDTVTFNNNNLQVVVGGDYITLPSNKLLLLNDVSGNIVSTDKANYYTGTNQYAQQTFFDARVDLKEDVYIDKRFIINNPTDTDVSFVILTNNDLGKIRFLRNVTADVNTSLNDKPSLSSDNTFTGSNNVFENSLKIRSIDPSNTIVPQLTLEHVNTTLNVLSSASGGAYNGMVDTGDSLIFWNDKLGGGLNSSAGLVIGPHSSTSALGIKIHADGKLDIGNGRIDLYEIYLKNALLLLTESMLSKIYYIRNLTADCASLDTNTFTGLQNIYNTSTTIGSTPNLTLSQNTRTTLGFISSTTASTYSTLTQENDAVIYWTDGLNAGGLNQSAGLVLSSFYNNGIRINKDGNLEIGGGEIKLNQIYLKNELLLLTESMLSKIYYIRNLTTDISSFDGTLTAPVDSDLIISTTTNTRKVVISYNLEVSGLASSDTTFTNKGRSVFEQQCTFENKVILQNEQDLCLTGTFGSNHTFSTIQSIPKYTRILGGINVVIPTPPSNGLNNGYEVTFIKYSSTAESQIISNTSCIYAKGSVIGTINVFFSSGLTVMKMIVFNDAWYEV